MRKVFILYLFYSQVLFSQRLQFERIGMEQGLPQSTVGDIIQDREGFLWLGTWDGLVRYDGYKFLTFRSNANDSTSLSNNNVRGLFQDSSGYLWVVTQQGLNRFHPRTASVKQFLPDSSDRLSIPTLHVYSVQQGYHGQLLLATVRGFSIFDTAAQTFSNYFLPSINISQGKYLSVNGLIQENEHIVWLGTLDGLARYELRTKTFELYPFTDHQGKKNGIYEPLKDNNGFFWCTASNGTVVVFDPVQKKYLTPFYKKKNIVNEYILHQFKLDKDGSIWIVAYQKLIHIKQYHRSSQENIVIDELDEYRHDPNDKTSLNAVSLLSFFKDRSDVIWVGTSSGLNKSIPKRKQFNSFDEYSLKQLTLSNHEVVGILRAGSDSLWVGTREGLFLLGRKGTSYAVLGKYFNIPKTMIYSLFQDQHGRVLAGTRDGLYVWNKKNSMFDKKRLLPSNENTLWRIFSFLYMDSTLWIGTNDGFFRSIDSSYQHFEQVVMDTAVSKVFQILHLVKGNTPHTILVCTNAWGLYRYDTRQQKFIQRYEHINGNTQSLSHSIIMHAYEDSNNTLWAASYGGGLNKIHEKDGVVSYTHYQEKDGLINNNLYCVLPDRNGTLWMTSNKGISSFDPGTGVFHNYDSRDGLPSDEYNQNSFCVDQNGKMTFGGVNGFVEFDPDKIQQNTIPPQIAITDFRVYEQLRNELLAEKEISLRYHENYLSFEFASLCFDAPLKNRYAYRMLGLNDQWTFTDMRRYASFTNLAPGAYVFQVKGTNNDGVWNETGASVAITILPPWWGTLWFRSVSGILFFSVIIGSVWFISKRKYQLRIEELKKQKELLEERQRTREQIARDLHDDVATTISSISLYAEMIHSRTKKKKSDLEDAIAKISSLSSTAKQSMEEVVWSLSPQHDTLNNLLNRIGDVAVQWCNDHSLQCHLSFCDIPASINISEETRKNIYLIFKEAMNNIIKHSNAGSVELLSWYEEEYFYLTIRDDGEGMSNERIKGKTIGGNGLTNMRLRAEKIGGELFIATAIDKGTGITIKIKIAQLRH